MQSFSYSAMPVIVMGGFEEALAKWVWDGKAKASVVLAEEEVAGVNFERYMLNGEVDGRRNALILEKGGKKVFTNGGEVRVLVVTGKNKSLKVALKARFVWENV